MLIRRLAAAVLFAAFGLAFSPIAAQARDHGTALSAKKAKAKHHMVRRGHLPRQAGGQIACTVEGCHPVSLRCSPTTEYDFWGNPTGYDAVACR